MSGRYLIGFLEIFYLCPEDILSVSWRFFIGLLEMIDMCPADIW